MGALTPFSRLFQLLVVSVILSPVWVAAAEKKPQAVQDLRYGVALYHYFQKDYYDSLSELMVAEQRGGIQGHGDTGDIMKGGLSLSMRMENQASGIFQDVLNDSHSQEVRNAAWFYLAKLRYRRADWSAAAASLANIQGSLNRPMQQEYDALQTNLAIRQQNLAQAGQTLRSKQKLTAWLPYVYYNLGAAHMREGNQALGVKYFDDLANLPLRSEEHLSLRDKALTAAGYSWMQQGDYHAAIARFTQVRLTSPMINQALLGYGWAATEIEDYGMALAPWQSLVERSPVNPSVQEALLAIPYAYEKVGASRQALEAFQAAEHNYDQQLAVIEGVNQRLEAGDLLQSLQGSSSDDNSDNHNTDNPYLRHLAELLAQQQFQNQVRDLRDLLAINDHLQDWRDKIAIYHHLLDQRESVREERLAAIDEQQFSENLRTLQAEYQAMSNRLAAIEAQQDVMALADADTLDLWQRVNNVEQAIATLKQNDQDLDEYPAWLARYKGLLLWQATEQFPDSLWQVKKNLKQLAGQIATAQQQHAQLDQVIGDAPDITPYRARLTALEQRLAEQQLALNGVLNYSETQLIALVEDELQKQVARLRYYQGHARLSVARLYDTAREAMLTPTATERDSMVAEQFETESSKPVEQEDTL